MEGLLQVSWSASQEQLLILYGFTQEGCAYWGVNIERVFVKTSLDI
jgi:hypothetical protein